MGRSLLFVALLVGLMFAGGLALPAASERTEAGLLQGGVLTLFAAVVAGIAVLRLDDRRPGALGFAMTRSAPREMAAGVTLGVCSIGIAAALMVVSGGLRYAPEAGTAGSWLTSIVRSFGVLLVPAFAEEALFRGYLFQVLARAGGAAVATIAGSAVFAVAHAPNPEVGPLAFGNLFLAGVLLSAAYLRTRSLWFASAVHLGWNWGMAGLLDLPVSGLDFLDTPLYEPALGGASWLTGGAFGPEGGVVGTLAFGLALLAVATLPGLDETPRMKALRPLVDADETEERHDGE